MTHIILKPVFKQDINDYIAELETKDQYELKYMNVCNVCKWMPCCNQKDKGNR